MSKKTEKSESRPLSLDDIHRMGGFAGANAGTCLVWRFCNAVKRNETPAIEDLKQLADALEPLKDFYMCDPSKVDNVRRERLDEFARRLKLKGKQGERKETFADALPYMFSVCRYYQKRDEHLRQGDNQKTAKKKARTWACEQENIGDRAMKNRIKKYPFLEQSYQSLLDVSEATSG